MSRLGSAACVIALAALTPVVSVAGPAAASANLCHPRADTVAPQITNVTFSTASVDVSNGPATITVTANAVDTSATGPGSGIRRMNVFVSGPRGGLGTSLTLSSGTADNGVWTGTLTVPVTAASGSWTLRQAFAEDRAHNEQDYDSFSAHAQSPTDIRLQAGWDQSFTVTGTAPPPPPTKTAGRLTGFTMSPLAVNTTHAAKKVHLTATFSGRQPVRASVYLASQARGGRFFKGVPLKPVGNHVWRGHFIVTRWVGDGKAQAQLDAQYAANVRPRSRYVSSEQLAARHFPSTVTITSDVDATKPVLQTLAISPGSVDTTGGPIPVTVTATASDTQSGVGRMNISIFSSRENAPGGFVNVALTKQGSEWVGHGTFRECVPSGSWRVDANLSDNAGNFANYRSKDLVAAGLPGRVAVTSTKGDVVPPNVNNATASAAQHQITLDFSEGVKNVTNATLDVFALKPASLRYQHTLPISAITCSNGATNVDCSGSGGLVTSAELSVPAIAAGRTYQLWSNIDSITSQLTDGTGNPLFWGYQVAQVTGS
jgi:hypothetical protein